MDQFFDVILGAVWPPAQCAGGQTAPVSPLLKHSMIIFRIVAIPPFRLEEEVPP
ncbi:hypothetical protein [Bifidobacterium pseudolongum]|uniref:hypothetical protein n=1 Tax=Bifidobacterium pseudolongum TaxID=1694 RepID=UPI0013EA8E0D|nr:hypothetical protein [Bifidobacterium pseudolongum]